MPDAPTLRDLVDLARAAVLFPWADRLLRRHGLAAALDWAEGPAAAGRLVPSPDEVAAAGRLARWLVRLGRLHPQRPVCLGRSLVLVRLLGRRGVPARLRLGVRKDASELAAHAWVEVGGAAIGESEDVAARFAVLLNDR